MLKAIAIDDEPPALNLLQRFCDRSNRIDLLATFTSAKAAGNWLSGQEADLLFLDINMPTHNGLDFYRSLDDRIMVIFTTAHEEYAVEGFNLSATDYLVKPFTYERFCRQWKAHDYYLFQLKKSSHTIQIRSEYSKVNVNTTNILFIEAYSDYLKIHLASQKTLITRMTMSSILELLPQDFIRTHRSYIISIKKIQKIKGKLIFIDGKKIPIGRTYLESVLREISSD
ncbi:MAG: LytTR family DNA-binding domain-containing protein [Saprospiraceae bacterium]